MVIVSADHLAVTPAGKPVTVPIPVAFVVVCLISVIIELTHKTGDEDAELTVFVGEMIKLPIAFTLPQPPINGIV
jgi:predicted signal transduction protein with EAL and GGDEF domain